MQAFGALVNFELDNTLSTVTVPGPTDPGENAEVDVGEFMA